MKNLIGTLLLLILILSACSPASLSPEGSPSTPGSDLPTSLPAATFTTEAPLPEVIPVSTTQGVPPPKLIATFATPHIDQGPDGAVTVPPSYPQDCGYQWAQQPLPELSSQFLESMQALHPDALATAFAFGENCVYTDGTATFLPMETDFNITIPVSDVTDTPALGEWVVKTMQVIDKIPPEQISGPRPGRVSILFENEQREGVAFYIDQYHALPAGLSPAEIYQKLKLLQP